VALGASPLRPEKSRNYSIGTVISAIPRLTLTVDAYQIDLRNRIVVTDNLTATRGPTGAPISANVTVGGVTFSGNPTGGAIANILNNAGFITTNAARFFINGIDTRTRGLDFVGTYRVPTGALGRLNLTAGFNYNKTKVRRNAAVPNALSNVPGLVLFGRQETLRLTEGQPKTKINGSADFDRDWFGATLRATRYGKVLGAGADLFGDVNLKAKVVTDLELRFKPVGDSATFALGGNNIFDVYPTNIPRGRGIDPATGLARNYPATNYVAPFSNFSPFGFNGRYLYARLSVNY
jgi:iron complex outermembrane receptor protein